MQAYLDALVSPGHRQAEVVYNFSNFYFFLSVIGETVVIDPPYTGVLHPDLKSKWLLRANRKLFLTKSHKDGDTTSCAGYLRIPLR